MWRITVGRGSLHDSQCRERDSWGPLGLEDVCPWRVEGQPWVPDGSTVGPRFLGGNRGFPHKNRQPWVPATSFLFCVRWATRPNCQPLTLSHLESDRGPTASIPSAARPHCILPARNLETLTIFLNFQPNDETLGGIPVISSEWREMLQSTRVRQVFRRGII